ncbi:MAG: OmpA family protein [Gemmatimonadetes bacterium]|nr:OmpA family protein [Gemmatimonadota bacterium]NNL30307.1 OmpA family protein [Gemmatimonadota bacterium]
MALRLRARGSVGATRAVVVAIALGATGCVSKGTHQSTLADLSQAMAGQDTLRDGIETLEERNDSLRAAMDVELARRDQVEAALQRTIADLEREQRSLEQELENARAASERLETMAGLRGAELQSMRRRLESLQAVEQEVRERNAIYEDVISRFQSLMDGGQLSVTIDRGRMVIQLPQDILFQSGSATLGSEGRSVISQVGEVLSDFDDRRFQVEGHTDNVPIATERFPSNWELSSARALAVVRLLTAQGVAPENVSGAAFGEYQPRASNEDRDNRALNRRIEIVMLPNLDVIAATQVPG